MSVFANGLGVSGKATDNKTLAAMPDVCLSPPPPPAGPVPIPYPNFGNASDTTDGCTSVFIKGKEAGKKNASKYSKITGDEPATRSFGASVVTHNITGPLKFEAYSFDVIFEGGGANRFTDLTSTNHSNPGSGFNASIDKVAVPEAPEDPDCQAMRLEVEAARTKLSEATSNKNATKGTISSFRTSNGESMVKASNQLMREKIGLEEPKLEDHVPGKGRPSKVCGGGAHHHPTQGNCNHTEAQAVDSISWSPAPKSIMMAIDYPAIQFDAKGRKTVDEEKKNWPCDACKRVLKKACACGVEVLICHDGQKADFCKNSEKPKP